VSSYLVDFENVQGSGLEGLQSLGSDDVVYIFYSANADKITFDLHRQLNETQAKVQYVLVKVGHKNALDFQLATYLGYLVANHADERFFLVTHDGGFDAIATFWKDNGVRVELADNLTGRSKTAARKELTGKVRDLIGHADEVDTVVSYILKYKTKTGLNNALVKKYDSQRAGEIYKAIKPLISDKKGSVHDSSSHRSGTSGSGNSKS
jgi:hypothetical protein